MDVIFFKDMFDSSDKQREDACEWFQTDSTRNNNNLLIA